MGHQQDRFRPRSSRRITSSVRQGSDRDQYLCSPVTSRRNSSTHSSAVATLMSWKVTDPPGWQ